MELEETADLGPRKKVALILAQNLLKEARALCVPVPLEKIVDHLRITHALDIERAEITVRVSGLLHVWKEDGTDQEFAYIAYNKDHPGCRQRFTIAHEIGHLLLKHGCADGAYGSTHNEREANIFAGELLIPTVLLRKDIKETPDIPTLSKLYRVSDHALGIKISEARLLGAK